MVSLVITICIISLSVMPLLSTRSSAPPHQTSMEPPHSQVSPRKLGPLEGSVPIARDGSSMFEPEEEEWRKDIVDSTGSSGDRYASQEKKAMTTATIHRQAGKDNKRRGTRMKWRMMMMEEESSSNHNPQSRRYYNKYYFTSDYSGVRRRRPIHNKSIPSSTTSSSAITPP